MRFALIPAGRFAPIPAARFAVAVVALVAPLAAPGSALAMPSPYRVVRLGALQTPPLDAFAFCVPSDVDPDLRRLAETAASSGARAAWQSLEALAETPGWRPVGLPLVRAGLRARLAEDATERRTAREALRRALAAGGPPGALACARLETARLELQAARHPEAAAQASLASGMRSQIADPVPIGDGAAFYRAEALYLSAHLERAAELYRRLASAPRARTAAAARLRLADIAFDQGDPAGARTEYEALLTKADVFGASVEGWALRAAEAAWAVDDVAAAANWIQRFLLADPDRDVRGLAEIRLADAYAWGGDAEASRQALERVREAHGSDAVGLLADVRRVDLAISELPPEEDEERLREAGRSPVLALSLYARATLAHVLRQRQEIDAALAVLTRLVYESPPLEVAPTLVPDVDAVMGLAASTVRGEDGCSGFVQRVGAHSAALSRRAADPRPFQLLAECYEHLRLPTLALKVHRELIRAFGAELGEAAALPVARAAFATGDVSLARTAAAAGVRRGGPRREQWALLLGEAERVEGRLDEAVEQLRPLVEAGAPEQDPTAAILALARTSVRRAGGDDARELLRRAIGTLDAGQRAAGGERLGEAAKLTAELFRKRGEAEPAAALYQLALERLPDGVQRAESAYWLGALHADEDVRAQAWQRAAGMANGGSWSRLAASELELAPLRRQVGLDEDAPAPAAAPRSVR